MTLLSAPSVVNEGEDKTYENADDDNKEQEAAALSEDVNMKSPEASVVTPTSQEHCRQLSGSDMKKKELAELDFPAMELGLSGKDEKDDLSCCGLFKPAANQVAGHEAGVGKLGPLMDGSGKFYKPLQNGDRGEREKKFYECFWADESIPRNVKSIFPFYFGVSEIEASDGSGLLEHVVLEDLTYKYKHPSVMDIKMGVRTWYAGASSKYITKCLEKDAESTSHILGFRVSGFQVYDNITGVPWKPGRDWCRKITVDTVKFVLKQFVSTNPTDLIPDAALAPVVYGGTDGIINQLNDLRDWFKSQSDYHFYSSSILLLYEGQGNDVCPSVKMIDFAHVFTGHDGIDKNFLEGLDSLLEILQQITFPS